MIQIKKKNLFTDSIFSSILEVFHKSNVFSSIDEKSINFNKNFEYGRKYRQLQLDMPN